MLPTKFEKKLKSFESSGQDKAETQGAVGCGEESPGTHQGGKRAHVHPGCQDS